MEQTEYEKLITLVKSTLYQLSTKDQTQEGITQIKLELSIQINRLLLKIVEIQTEEDQYELSRGYTTHLRHLRKIFGIDSLDKNIFDIVREAQTIYKPEPISELDKQAMKIGYSMINQNQIGAHTKINKHDTEIVYLHFIKKLTMYKTGKLIQNTYKDTQDSISSQSVYNRIKSFTPEQIQNIQKEIDEQETNRIERSIQWIPE